RDVRVAEHRAAAATELITAFATRLAMATGHEGFDGDAIADVDLPTLGGTVADALDDTERLMAGDQRQAYRKQTGVLLGVAAADAARLQPQQRTVLIDVGNRQLAHFQRTGTGLNNRSRLHRPTSEHRPLR